MLSLNHFVVENSRWKYKFVDLVVASENLDKDDFLDSNYFMDPKVHLRKASKGAIVATKGKRRMREDKELEHDGSWPKMAVTLDDNDEGHRIDDVQEVERWVDPVDKIEKELESADAGTSCEISETSEMGGSSDTFAQPSQIPLAGQPLPTLMSSARASMKKKRPPVPHKKQWIIDPGIDLILENREENMRARELDEERNQRARIEMMEESKLMMKVVMEIVPSLVAKTLEIMGTRSLFSIDPLVMSPQLLLSQQAHASSDSTQ